MDRPPPPPTFDLDLQLDEEDRDLLGFGPGTTEPAKKSGRMGPFRALGEKLAQRVIERDAQRQLADVVVGDEPGRVETLSPELDDFIIRLPSSRDFEVLLEEERSATLFEEFEEQRARSIQASNVGMWLTALIFAFLAVLHGSDFFHGLTDQHLHLPAFLVDRFHRDGAREIIFAAAALSLTLAFSVCAESCVELVNGLRSSNLARAMVGGGGLAGLWIGLLLIGSHAYLPAVVVLVLARGLMRVLIIVLRAAGVMK